MNGPTEGQEQGEVRILEYDTSDPTGYFGGYRVVRRRIDDINFGKVALLNSLIAFPDVITYAVRIKPELARRIVQKASTIESYIGHPSTAAVISQLFGVQVPVNRAEFRPNDVSQTFAIAVKLKQRAKAPGDVEVTLDDLEFFLVQYIPA